eukprot:3881299-Rhodomonas_salina.1
MPPQHTLRIAHTHPPPPLCPHLCGHRSEPSLLSRPPSPTTVSTIPSLPPATLVSLASVTGSAVRVTRSTAPITSSTLRMGGGAASIHGSHVGINASIAPINGSAASIEGSRGRGRPAAHAPDGIVG